MPRPIHPVPRMILARRATNSEQRALPNNFYSLASDRRSPRELGISRFFSGSETNPQLSRFGMLTRESESFGARFSGFETNPMGCARTPSCLFRNREFGGSANLAKTLGNQWGNARSREGHHSACGVNPSGPEVSTFVASSPTRTQIWNKPINGRVQSPSEFSNPFRIPSVLALKPLCRVVAPVSRNR